MHQRRTCTNTPYGDIPEEDKKEQEKITEENKDLVERVETQIRQTLLDRLGLARRSGALVVGTEKTKDKLKQGKLRLLVLASDGSPNTLDPLVRIAAGVNTSVLRSETAQILATALGRASAVCSGVTDSRMAKTIRADHALLGAMAQPSSPVAEAAS